MTLQVIDSRHCRNQAALGKALAFAIQLKSNAKVNQISRLSWASWPFKYC